MKTGLRPGPAGTEVAPGQRDGQSATALCPVTIICGDRRLDVVLPSTVPCSDLLPGLLRLLAGDSPTAGLGPLVAAVLNPPVRQPVRTVPTSGPPTVPGAHPVKRWVMVPLGRRALDSADTLSSAGVLVGDVLVIDEDGRSAGRAPVLDSLRERVAEVVDDRAKFWSDRWSRRVAGWTAAITGALLLIPTSTLPAGPSTALLAATVAVIFAGIGLCWARIGERRCATATVLIAAGWAACAGAAGAEWCAGPAAETRPVLVLAAAASGLLVSGCVAVADRAAILPTTALAVATLGAAATAIAAAFHLPAEQAAVSTALLAVSLLGVLPRAAITAAGLAGSADDPPGSPKTAGRAVPADAIDLEGRIAAADRLCTGALVGLCLLIVGGILPAALSHDDWSRWLAGAVGLLLPLRARAFSQLPHTLGLRISGSCVLAAAWVGCYSMSGDGQPMWIMAAAASVAVGAAATMASPARSAVGRARSARLLGVAEHLLVVAIIVLAAGQLGLFGWATAVLGR